MSDWFVFDDENLKRLLLCAAREGFAHLKHQYADETFYCFALYSHESYSFVYTAASSEQGLSRAAETQLAQDRAENRNWFNALSLDQVKVILRHKIADSPLHEPTVTASLFKEVWELTEARSTLLFNRWCMIANRSGEQAAFDAIRPHNQKFIAMCFEVLQELDREKLFGKGKQRQRIVVNFLTASQSDEEMIAYARSLNPPAVAKRYERELKEAASCRCPEARHGY